jgi:hypothetical protein
MKGEVYIKAIKSIFKVKTVYRCCLVVALLPDTYCSSCRSLIQPAMRSHIIVLYDLAGTDLKNINFKRQYCKCVQWMVLEWGHKVLKFYFQIISISLLSCFSSWEWFFLVKSIQCLYIRIRIDFGRLDPDSGSGQK